MTNHPAGEAGNRRLGQLALTVALLCGALISAPLHAQDLGGGLGGGTVQATGDGVGIGSNAGGGSQADFSQIMQLVQTTIEPETWEALGGPSTMFPYPAGIYVDASGTIQDVNTPIAENVAADLKVMLARGSVGSVTVDADDPDAWRYPSAMRCVSLRRLLAKYAQRRVEQNPSTEAMLHLAGLSKIQFVHFSDDDVILAGPVGGIDDGQGHLRDRGTGLSTIRLDGLAGCFAATAGHRGFGCSIDPTQAGLQNAMQVAASLQNGKSPMGTAAKKLGEAVGLQDVRIFGVNSDSSLAWLMVEADRHMKQLALGEHPMPDGVSNYLDQIENHIDRGLPTDLLLRLWFASSPMSARQSEDGSIVELAGRSIRLSGQNEMAVANGQRGLITRDVRSVAFVEEFNRHWTAIRSEYPIYGSLESVFHSAAVAELIHRRVEQEQDRASATAQIVAAFSAIASSDQHGFAPPKQVETLAVSHEFRHGRQRHQVVVASGGVTVMPEQSLKTTVSTYRPLNSLPSPVKKQPADVTRWWWNG
ncbi:MAG: DUF1598 domain-containing protein [Planctomycetota bacterium]